MQRYRSGHNEAVLKTVCPQGHVGSNPTLCAKEKVGIYAISHINPDFFIIYTHYSLSFFFPSSSLFLYARNAMFSQFFHQIVRNKLYLFVCTAESKFFTIGTGIEQKNTPKQSSLFPYSHSSPITSSTYYL